MIKPTYLRKFQLTFIFLKGVHSNVIITDIGNVDSKCCVKVKSKCEMRIKISRELKAGDDILSKDTFYILHFWKPFYHRTEVHKYQELVISKRN